MTSISRIQRKVVTVGVDGSAAALSAAGWAAAEAGRRGTGLQIVHAMVGVPAGLHPNASRRDRELVAQQRGNRVLQAAVRRANVVAPEVAVMTQLSRESPVRALISVADISSVLVVGASPAGLLFGSTGSAVVSHATCPVAVVPRPSGVHNRVPGPILLGVDYGRRGVNPQVRPAIDYAFAAADRENCRLLAVHVWNDLGGVVPLLADWQKMDAEQRLVLSTALRRWTRRSPDIVVDFLAPRGHPRRELVRLGQSARLIVVGARSHRGFAAMTLGSVSRTVLHHAECPVVVVHEDASF
ncbi:universal stress protein [Fodinicola acaciae]|uniref:universal stress protein n=1 Tax=Fodinicola acaciae TaxID=2681555 RepID=UPI0013D8371E|nr:universal stress protein [Fodinicola acaciae]